MFRMGIVNDLDRLMPVFEGFDDKPELDLSANYVEPEQEEKIDNVVVPKLPQSLNDKFDKKKVAEEPKVPADTMGSAGNSLIADEPEPQMGSIGGLGKNGFSLTESGDGTVIDDSGMKQAHKNHSENSMDNVMDMFNQFAFKPMSKVKFDVDTSKPQNITTKEPIKRIPKGW